MYEFCIMISKLTAWQNITKEKRTSLREPVTELHPFKHPKHHFLPRPIRERNVSMPQLPDNEHRRSPGNKAKKVRCTHVQKVRFCSKVIQIQCYSYYIHIQRRKYVYGRIFLVSRFQGARSCCLFWHRNGSNVSWHRNMSQKGGQALGDWIFVRHLLIMFCSRSLRQN